MTPHLKVPKWQHVHSSIVCHQIACAALSVNAVADCDLATGEGIGEATGEGIGEATGAATGAATAAATSAATGEGTGEGTGAATAETSHRASDHATGHAVGASPSSVGQITLREHQRDACVRLKTSIQQFGGALLADAVGLGKTYVALKMACDYATVHVLAPATLLPMWRSAVSATGSRHVLIHSLHRLSRGPINAVSNVGRSLIIVDEAHHLRTRNTERYKNAVTFTAGHDVLLLTATPLHNNARELRNLLALFLGHRADALDNAMLAQCVVRRTSTAVETHIPSVREFPPHRVPDNQMVLERLLTLPPPLPVHEGAAASALVRLGLLRAWCSSDAALSESIRRRQLRGEALMHSLAHGRYPTQRELQSWIVGNDSVQLGFPELLVATTTDDTADMLKTLLAHLDGLQSLLQLHTRTALADARRAELLRSLVGTETLTLNSVERRAERTPGSNAASAAPPAIVAFSQFASTVRALHRALSDLAGIASLTSDGGRIASGAISREELIANFAPRANGRPPPPAAERIRLLLTTDLLSEGVNLQDAGVVVHLDLPWTHALRQQRVGRLARMGSAHAVVDVHTFEPPMGTEAVLRIVSTLARKAGLQRQFVGSESGKLHSERASTLSGADEATQLREYWHSWRRPLNGHEVAGAATGGPASIIAGEVLPTMTVRNRSAIASDLSPTTDTNTNTTAIAALRATMSGWIAAVAVGGATQIIACCEHGAGFNEVIGTDPAILLRAVSSACTPALEPGESSASSRTSPPSATSSTSSTSITSATSTSSPTSPTRTSHVSYTASLPEAAEHALQQLQLFLQTQSLRIVAGPDARTFAPVQKRALNALSSRFSSLSALARTAIAPRIAALTRAIQQSRGAGAEMDLVQWTLAAPLMRVEEWLVAFPGATAAGSGAHEAANPPCLRNSHDTQHTRNTHDTRDTRGIRDTHDTRNPRVIALLLLQEEPAKDATSLT